MVEANGEPAKAPEQGGAHAGDVETQHSANTSPGTEAHHHEHADSDSDYASEHDDDHEDGTHTPVVLSAETNAALVKQIEFYFSDANLPSDKKLLKQIRKDPGGFVPVKLFANFRKVRAMTRDVGAITAALRASRELALSEDEKRVCRRTRVPEYDVEEIQRRTIVVEHLPPSPTIESVTEMFGHYGRVKLVRICNKESRGKLPAWLTGAQGAAGLLHGQGPAREVTPHAYVEYESEECAIMAVAAMHDMDDRRYPGMQVRHLVFPCSHPRNTSSSGGASGGGAIPGRSPRAMQKHGSGNSRHGSRDASPSTRTGGERTSAGSAHRRGSPAGHHHAAGIVGGSTGSGNVRSSLDHGYSHFNMRTQHHHHLPGAATPPRHPHISSIHQAGNSSASWLAHHAGEHGAAPPLHPSASPPPAHAAADAAAHASGGRYVPPARRSLDMSGSAPVSGTASPAYPPASPARPLVPPGMPPMPTSAFAQPSSQAKHLGSNMAARLAAAAAAAGGVAAGSTSGSAGSNPQGQGGQQQASTGAGGAAGETPSRLATSSTPTSKAAAGHEEAHEAAAAGLAGASPGASSGTAADKPPLSKSNSMERAAPKFVLDLHAPVSTSAGAEPHKHERHSGTGTAAAPGAHTSSSPHHPHHHAVPLFHTAHAPGGSPRSGRTTPRSTTDGSAALGPVPGGAAAGGAGSGAAGAAAGVPNPALLPSAPPSGEIYFPHGQFIEDVESFINKITSGIAAKVPGVAGGQPGPDPTAGAAASAPIAIPGGHPHAHLSPALSMVREADESGCESTEFTPASSVGGAGGGGVVGMPSRFSASAAIAAAAAAAAGGADVVATVAALRAAVSPVRAAAAGLAGGHSPAAAAPGTSPAAAVAPGPSLGGSPREGGEEDDAEIQRLRQALAEVSGGGAAAARAEAHAARVAAAAAVSSGAGRTPGAPKPPLPPGAAAAQSAGGSGSKARRSSWHVLPSGAEVDEDALEAAMRAKMGIAGDSTGGLGSEAGGVSEGDDDEEGGEGITEGGAGSEGGTGRRRRRRRGSRSGARSRRASQDASEGGAAPSAGGAAAGGAVAGAASRGASVGGAGAGKSAGPGGAIAAASSAHSGGAPHGGTPHGGGSTGSHGAGAGHTGASTGADAAGANPPKPKKHSKKDYASWAAATPEFRAVAAAKYGATGSGTASPVPGSGSHLHGAASPNPGILGTSPGGRSYLSEGGLALAGGNGHGHHAPHVINALGPDGTKGFMGRGRPLHPPPPHA
mmetsp:Transcript_8907/g.22026  ORF Transcript_8907/g.22026 Transcript_8907/m.22026 type:complete len:1254 (-) Transcript_8907:769-4530(-)|eukprot:CAMPEP_0202861922 /NCGR_PEP_ID=MMETSP1391-20130828/3147_1 /ASSEMBLY_ACC=CAM_ASM_000867 /TAXON_ID=1034604 /ORGANISM="Chlamydomonas leiostraca, Strain SAG 11-49" /LENGTH=1253 /DNA_ID=CAMNT_0049541377 /DNA_START=168 /DNA_END=3929 /DNA_ORIENTATION=-